DRINGSRAGQARFVVLGLDVVEELVFGGAPVDVVVYFRPTIKDAAVAGLTDFPIEAQLEVRELISGDEIPDRAALGERAIGDFPAGRDGLGLVPAPPVERRAIEQRAYRVVVRLRGRGPIARRDGKSNDNDRGCNETSALYHRLTSRAR